MRKKRDGGAEEYHPFQCRFQKRLHTRLAHAAVDLEMTQIGVIEYLIEEYLEDMLLNPPSGKRPEEITP